MIPEGSHLVIDVNGVGYIVYCSGNVLGNYQIEDKIEIIVETIVKENNISIFGFKNDSDKILFNHLLTIQGVGAKLAQTIIGVFDTNQIIEFVQSNSSEKFTTITGVGPKLATRLINELKNKNFTNKLQSIKGKYVLNNKNSQIVLDAKSALCNLGYSQDQVKFAINKVVMNNNVIVLEDYIKTCIRVLSS